MHHQVFYRDRPRSGHGVVERAVGPAQHAHRTELRHPARDGIVELELAFIQQPQREGYGHGLRHRGEPEDRAAMHGHLALHVEPAGRRVGDELTFVPDLRHDAGDVAGVDRGARGFLHGVLQVRGRHRRERGGVHRAGARRKRGPFPLPISRRRVIELFIDVHSVSGK